MKSPTEISWPGYTHAVSVPVTLFSVGVFILLLLQCAVDWSDPVVRKPNNCGRIH
jgi:hypothetical protein